MFALQLYGVKQNCWKHVPGIVADDMYMTATSVGVNLSQGLKGVLTGCTKPKTHARIVAAGTSIVSLMTT